MQLSGDATKVRAPPDHLQRLLAGCPWLPGAPPPAACPPLPAGAPQPHCLPTYRTPGQSGFRRSSATSEAHKRIANERGCAERRMQTYPLTKADHSSKCGSSPEPSSSCRMPLPAGEPLPRGEDGSLEQRRCGLTAKVSRSSITGASQKFCIQIVRAGQIPFAAGSSKQASTRLALSERCFMGGHTWSVTGWLQVSTAAEPCPPPQTCQLHHAACWHQHLHQGC